MQLLYKFIPWLYLKIDNKVQKNSPRQEISILSRLNNEGLAKKVCANFSDPHNIRVKKKYKAAHQLNPTQDSVRVTGADSPNLMLWMTENALYI